MTLLRVPDDKKWFITEERLRFPVNAEVPPSYVPLVVAKDLARSIDILEKKRGWKFLETIPSHRNYITPCCTRIAKGKPGEVLKIKFEPSALQADTDEADGNTDNAYDFEGKRLYKDNIIDWVAILHFWTPSITIWGEQEISQDTEGFVPTLLLPKELLAVNRRLNKNGTNTRK